MIPDWMDDEAHMQDVLLSELAPRTQATFKSLLGLDRGLSLLMFLIKNSHTLLTIEDIAFNVNESYSADESTLSDLVDMGLARRVQVASLVLYGLTSDPVMQSTIQDLQRWQDKWQTRLDRIAHIVSTGHPAERRT